MALGHVHRSANATLPTYTPSDRAPGVFTPGKPGHSVRAVGVNRRRRIATMGVRDGSCSEQRQSEATGPPAVTALRALSRGPVDGRMRVEHAILIRTTFPRTLIG